MRRGEQIARANAALRDIDADSRRFAEVDDGDLLLSFEEFVVLQPAAVRKRFGVEQLRSWFDDADVDKSGALSIGEYFGWTLRNAALKHGDHTIRAVFQKYDKDNSGRLTLAEYVAGRRSIGLHFPRARGALGCRV